MVPGRGDNAGDGPIPDKALAAFVQREVDAVGGRQVDEVLPDLGADDCVRGCLLGFDHDDVAAVSAGGGSHLESDPSRADDHEQAARGEAFP